LKIKNKRGKNLNEAKPPRGAKRSQPSVSDWELAVESTSPAVYNLPLHISNVYRWPAAVWCVPWLSNRRRIDKL
jgi:hypothetical protein